MPTQSPSGAIIYPIVGARIVFATLSKVEGDQRLWLTPVGALAVPGWGSSDFGNPKPDGNFGLLTLAKNPPAMLPAISISPLIGGVGKQLHPKRWQSFLSDICLQI
jgi:hypothetical protein